jgi:ferredoxin
MRSLMAKPKKAELSEAGCSRDAEQNCPVNCIHVEEE